MNDTLAAFIRQHQIHEIECVIPDMTGVARGKIVPKNLFLAEDTMKMSKAVLTITVNGEFAEFERFAGANDPDMVCRPDPATIRLVRAETVRRQGLAPGGGAGDGVLPDPSKQQPA